MGKLEREKRAARERIEQRSKEITDALIAAVRDGVADGIVRLMQAPGVFPAADFLQAIEQGTALGVRGLVDAETTAKEPSRGKKVATKP